MTREQAIERWKPIIQAVFAAENDVIDQWQARLKAAKKMAAEEQVKVIDEYLTAIATEIVNRISDKELEEL